MNILGAGACIAAFQLDMYIFYVLKIESKNGDNDFNTNDVVDFNKNFITIISKIRFVYEIKTEQISGQ